MSSSRIFWPYRIMIKFVKLNTLIVTIIYINTTCVHDCHVILVDCSETSICDVQDLLWNKENYKNLRRLTFLQEMFCSDFQCRIRQICPCISLLSLYRETQRFIISIAMSKQILQRMYTRRGKNYNINFQELIFKSTPLSNETHPKQMEDQN